MHRTEAANASAGLYVDRNLPSTPGTLLEASDRNAIQEEIANVIERAGLALKIKSTDVDFDQLEEALFDTAFTRTAPIFITGSGDSSHLDLKAGIGTDWALAYTSANTGRVIKIGPSGITVEDGTDSVSINGGGIAYAGPSLSAVSVARSDFTLTDSSFSMTETSSGSLTWYDTGTSVNLTNLVYPKVIKAAWISCKLTADSSRICTPCQITVDNNGGTVRVSSIVFSGVNVFSAAFDSHKLTVEYEN